MQLMSVRTVNVFKSDVRSVPLMDRLNTVTKKYGMKINVKKTKVMCISRTGNHKLKILVEGQRVEQVTQFKYLGSIISSDGYCEKHIRSRIVTGKQAFGNKTRKFSKADKPAR